MIELRSTFEHVLYVILKLTLWTLDMECNTLLKGTKDETSIVWVTKVLTYLDAYQDETVTTV